MQCAIQKILDYLLHLKESGFAISSIKVNLAVISVFYPHIIGGIVLL